MTIKRVLSCLPALALLAALLPASTRADDVGDLLAKHKAYVGFSFGDGSISNLETTWSVTSDKDGKTIATGGDKYFGIASRSDETNLKSHTSNSTGFTGNISWRSDRNGITVPVIGDPAKLGMAETLFFTDAISIEPWTLGDTAQIDGSTYRIVHVAPKIALPLDLYVDPATGAFKRVVIDPGGDYEETIDVLAYANALPGKKIVSKWKADGGEASAAYTKIAANVTMTGADLHPPEQTATWTFANPKPFPIKVTPYRFIVKALVNGVEGTFILDTGASSIFLSDDFARRAKIKDLGNSMAGGIAGSMKVRSGRADTIEVGGNTLSNVIVTYGGTGIDTDAPDGLLGFDLLAAAFVTLDINGSTLQIQDPSIADPSSIHGVEVGVDLSTGQPSVPMVANGTANLYATLDSGDAAQVLFPVDFPSKNHLLFLVDNSIQGYFVSHAAIGGVSGGYEVDDCGKLSSISLGPIVYQHAGACESRSFSGHSGLVGFDFLKNFAQLVFDYPRAIVVFVPQQ